MRSSLRLGARDPTETVAAELSARDVGEADFASAAVGAFEVTGAALLVPACGGGTGVPFLSEAADAVPVTGALPDGALIAGRVESAGFAADALAFAGAAAFFPGAAAGALCGAAGVAFAGADAFPLDGAPGLVAGAEPVAGVVPGLVALMTGAL